jgi:AraC-like DNA-binding protein
LQVALSLFYLAFGGYPFDPSVILSTQQRGFGAADKLIETRMTVNEICYSVGINDAFYFSKLFKRAYGLTPTEYRKTYQKK